METDRDKEKRGKKTEGYSLDMLLKMGCHLFTEGLLAQEHAGKECPDDKMHTGVFCSDAEDEGNNHGNTEFRLFEF